MGRISITGGAGFVGSHLCDAVLDAGHDVVAIDNLVTGSVDNIAHLLDEARFTFVDHDISRPWPELGDVDGILHFASPASPIDYLELPIETLEAGSLGTMNVLQLAHRVGARVVLASTSEVYGDPLVHPQVEEYWGNVNPVGPRSVYDEAKRFSEAVTMAYHRTHGVSVGIIRIFNTYGPRMRPSDGRVVSNFIGQALAGTPLTVYGDGSQTRSFCFVSDLVRGILAVLASDEVGPLNLGSPGEFTMLELAEVVLELTGSASAIVHEPLPEDDPRQRQPDITRIGERLGWVPEVPLAEGVARTIEWFRATSGVEDGAVLDR